MSWPPYLLKIRLENEDHAFTLWLPLFLIGPVVLIFLLAIFVIILPFALLSIIFTWELGWGRTLFLLIPSSYRLFTQLPGLHLDVAGNNGRIYVAFI